MLRLYLAPMKTIFKKKNGTLHITVVLKLLQMLNTLSQLTIHCEVKKKECGLLFLSNNGHKSVEMAKHCFQQLEHLFPLVDAIEGRCCKPNIQEKQLKIRSSNDFIFFLSNSLSTTRQIFYYSNNIKGVLCTCL